MRDLLTLPKVDLHVHLEGSIRPLTLAEVSDRVGSSIPGGLRDGRWAFAGFDDFIAQYDALDASLGGLDDLRRYAYEFCEDERREGVQYAEVTMTPAGHARRLGSWEGPLEAVLDGFQAGERDFGITCQLVLDIARGVPLEWAQPTVDLAVSYADRGVVALGLGGSESARPARAFVSFFAQAVSSGLHSVPHAGEVCGPESVWDAINELAAERIGHGIRSVEDEALLEVLRDLEIVLEVCPSSNVFTKSVDSVVEHPLPRLVDAGVFVTLNSDDPAMFASAGLQ